MNDLVGKVSREDILKFQGELAKLPGVEFGDSALAPVTHHFAPGSYAREMLIPKGTIVVGKTHKQAHHSFLMKGEITVVSEEGIKRLKAPMVILSQPNAKRVGFAHEDTIWVTVHPTDETDLEKIEEQVIQKEDNDYIDAKLTQLLREV